DNEYTVTKEGFVLKYGSGKIAPSPDKKKILIGVFPKAIYSIVEAVSGLPLEMLNAAKKSAPAFAGRTGIKSNQSYYFSIYKPDLVGNIDKYESLSKAFDDAEKARQKLVNRVKINTPDPFINTLGGALAVAADGIWESPTYLH